MGKFYKWVQSFFQEETDCYKWHKPVVLYECKLLSGFTLILEDILTANKIFHAFEMMKGTVVGCCCLRN